MPEDAGGTVQAEARRLTAIMFTDMVGFSRQMGTDEARTLRVLEVHNRIIQQAVVEYAGHVIKTIGDAFLVDFPSVVNAVQCAQRIQTQFRAHNGDKEPAQQIHVRIGIHSGDIVQRDGDVFGDGVNVASRLQALAEPDTICLSQVVYQEVEKKLSLGTVVSLGRPKLKNIAQRFQIYALLPEQPKGFRQTLWVLRLKTRRVGTAHPTMRAMLLLVGLFIVGGIVIFLYPSLLPFRIPQSAFRNQEALPLPDKPSVVVLPFVNMSEDPKQEYFSDGITEDLTTDLCKVSGLFVIARNSAFTYKGKAVKVQDVSKELGVRYVLEGSVRKSDNQVRITAQLIDATTGRHLWSERYDRPMTELFALQDESVQQIMAALKVEVREAELERVRRTPTENLNAYDYVLRGTEYFQRFTKEAHAQARQMFERAIELDPKYAEAYVKLGGIYWTDWYFQWNQDSQNSERAFELVQRAIALDNSLPQAHSLLGQIYLYNGRQYEQAIAEGERAVALDPNCAQCHTQLGNILNFAGRPGETLGLVEKAMRFDPYYPFFPLSILGQAYFFMERYEEAIAAWKRSLAINPHFLAPHIALAGTYSLLNRKEEAQTEAETVLRMSPNFSVEGLRQRAVDKDEARSERFLAALRRAGLK